MDIGKDLKSRTNQEKKKTKKIWKQSVVRLENELANNTCGPSLLYGFILSVSIS